MTRASEIRKSAFLSAEEREHGRQAKRIAVLETAASMFCARGYAATQMGDVARELGVTKPTIYHYFKNKDDILNACFEEGFSLFEQTLKEGPGEHRSGAERLRAVLMAYATCMTRDFGKCTVLVPISDLDEPGRSRIAAQLRRFDGRIRSLVAEAVEDGSIPPCDPKIMTFTILGSLNWIARWHKSDGELGPDATAKAITDQLFAGIGGKTQAWTAPKPVHARRRGRSGT
jgi:AcrR family transcriptional regulator